VYFSDGTFYNINSLIFHEHKIMFPRKI